MIAVRDCVLTYRNNTLAPVRKKWQPNGTFSFLPTNKSRLHQLFRNHFDVNVFQVEVIEMLHIVRARECASRVPRSSSLRCKSMGVYCYSQGAMMGLTEALNVWPHGHRLRHFLVGNRGALISQVVMMTKSEHQTTGGGAASMRGYG